MKHQGRRVCLGWIGLLLLLSSACTGDVPERGIALGEAARPSFEVRLDDSAADPAEFHLVEDDDGIRIQTGPAGIAYRPDDVISRGDFHFETTILQYDAPVGYREAFGVFVGGLDLVGPEQEYAYLLIRTTGEFLIKRRVGEVTETLVDWTAHDAVVSVTTEGDLTQNILGVDVFAGQVRFSINGTVVHELPAGRVRPYGIAGVRVNHRLDVRVDDWQLVRIESES